MHSPWRVSQLGLSKRRRADNQEHEGHTFRLKGEVRVVREGLKIEHERRLTLLQHDMLLIFVKKIYKVKYDNKSIVDLSVN